VIRNYDQYRKAKARARRLEQALDQLKGDDTGLTKVLRDSLSAQIDEVGRQLATFEALEHGFVEAPAEGEGLARLPDMLVRARIASQLTQRELGRRVGLHENQIQQYESSRYQRASLRRIQEIAQALDLDFALLLRYSARKEGASKPKEEVTTPENVNGHDLDGRG
jgi:DNA-binding XRE family transcriptional regulator